MADKLMLYVCKQWCKLAEKDLKEIKKHLKKTGRFRLVDAYNIGAMEVEIVEIENWVVEATHGIGYRH